MTGAAVRDRVTVSPDESANEGRLMKKLLLLAAFCALAMPALAVAETSRTPQLKAAAAQDTRKVQQAPPAYALRAAPVGILRQDLFDRNDPNNLRSDWPGPPA